MGNTASAHSVDILLSGKEIPDDHLMAYTVERDVFQPDMASILLTNQSDIYSKTKIGDPIEIKVGDSTRSSEEEGNASVASIFQGEVVGLEPTYSGKDKSKILIRALNKMHRLLRKRKSLTYTDKSDEQIFQQVVADAGLSLKWERGTAITYKHVYQHNQTDLEFLRTRAARLGYHMWCEGSDLYAQPPKLDQDSGLEASVDKPAGLVLLSFTPRLSSAPIVKKVTVKGWNPETKELIVGEASVSSSKLGSQTGQAASSAFGDNETFTVDHPIWSKEEANALAKARLMDLSLGFMTGEAECKGNSKLKPGIVVKFTPNSMDTSDPFNGKYYVMGVTHRFASSHSHGGGDSGFVSILRLARDAAGGQ